MRWAGWTTYEAVEEERVVEGMACIREAQGVFPGAGSVDYKLRDGFSLVGRICTFVSYGCGTADILLAREQLVQPVK